MSHSSRRLTFLLSAATALFGCQSPSPEPAHEHAAAPAEHAGHAGHAAQDAPVVALNNGQPWVMDDHTRLSLGRLEARFAAGPATDDVAGHQALGRDLDAELQTLIQGCTMEGAAHDQLHVWLGALLPAVRDLQSSTDLAGLRTQREKVDALVKTARASFR